MPFKSTKATLAIATALAGLALAAPAQALDFEFTMVGSPPSGSMFQRPWQPGNLTGVIYGLADNAADQMPLALEIRSGFEPVGLSQLTYSAAQWQLLIGPGFDVVNGNLTDATFAVNLIDPVYGNTVLVFKAQMLSNWTALYNGLAWNGGPIGPGLGTGFGVGNDLGALGVTYAQAVPEPAAAALLALGLATLTLSRLAASRRRVPAQ